MCQLGLYLLRITSVGTQLNLYHTQAVNWIIAFTTPLFLAKSSSGPYFLFGGCSILTTLVCLAFQPETRGSSLEEVEQAFNESPWRSILKKRPFIDMAARRRAQSNLPAADDEGIELADFIQLPEVRYGGPWHYAHRLTN
ncbi:hypothetical protein PHLCEN_2v12110 [Hermanssonia centrifuga]|uniref:Uncharacterized protein n=1 Tax=Hermanssonia centrifuga TaxID=98765 RepID=A0A2R6NHY7_9APHY|nr:hypothetical protein PHLCEN_2v12110 [Hermanssonia centrifuga]